MHDGVIPRRAWAVVAVVVTGHVVIVSKPMGVVVDPVAYWRFAKLLHWHDGSRFTAWGDFIGKLSGSNFAHLCHTASKGAIATLLLTFMLTIVFDLVTAIAVGMLITVVLFMKMVSEETEVKGWKYYCDADSEVTHLRELPKSVRVYEINGPMFFGMTDRITDISVKEFTKYLIIRMRGVPSLDATGMNALENLYEYCAENGVQLIFSHANEQPMRTMRRAGFVDLVGEERFRPNIDDAIAYARTQLEQEEKAA